MIIICIFFDITQHHFNTITQQLVFQTNDYLIKKTYLCTLFQLFEYRIDFSVTFLTSATPSERISKFFQVFSEHTETVPRTGAMMIQVARRLKNTHTFEFFRKFAPTSNSLTAAVTGDRYVCSR